MNLRVIILCFSCLFLPFIIVSVEKTMQRLLVTGFLHSSSLPSNSSELGLREIRKEKEDINLTLLKVSYAEADKFISSLTEDDVLLSFGYAPFLKSFTLDYQAKNRRGTEIEDGDGFIPSSILIDKNGPTHLRTSLPYQELFNRLKEKEDKIVLSDYSGSFLCNYLYYNSLRKTGGKALFFHLPPFSDEFSLKRITDFINYVLFLSKNLIL